jgi:uncharacterized protein
LGGYAQSQFNPNSHVHQMPNNGYPTQATPVSITPTSLSRPGSPTSAGQSGPNKKRKSSSFHKRIPSGLQMTPRVDTNQPTSSGALSGLSMASPIGGGFAGNDPSFMTIPNNVSAAQFYGSNPTTPANEQSGFAFGAAHQLDIRSAQNASAYFSHPSSAVPSRSNSPVLAHTRNISGYGRGPVQTTTNQLGRAAHFSGGQVAPGANDDGELAPPTITKITPASGPISGGTEVSIFGYGFTRQTTVLFGDTVATTTFYGEQSILASSPPGRPGQVPITVTATHRSLHTAMNGSGPPAQFTYIQTTQQEMEMALRFLSQKEFGDPALWMQYTNEVANQFMQTSISQTGFQGGGSGGGGGMYHPG